MSDQKSWHDQDAYWEFVELFLFNQERKRSASGEVEKIVRLLAIKKQDRILDLPCGIGRHSLALARLGYEVVGVDRTPGYIEKAKQNAEDDGLDVTFVVGDMREYCQPSGFDIALNLFGSIGYFEDPEDNRQVIENMYESLRPGGMCLIETMGKAILARDFHERGWSEEGDALILAERKPVENWSRVQTRWIVVKDGRREEHTVSVRLYSALELSSLISDCGFHDVRVYGDIEGNPYNQEAKRLVVVGTR